MITNSKEIDELRLKEREAFSKFFEFKKKFAEANNALKGKLKDFSDVNSEIHKIKHEKEEKIIFLVIFRSCSVGTSGEGS